MTGSGVQDSEVQGSAVQGSRFNLQDFSFDKYSMHADNRIGVSASSFYHSSSDLCPWIYEAANAER
jgi:hypothetical protein